MIRMLGVLCGAAIATGLLTWLVGVPQFSSEREPVENALAVVTLPAAALQPAPAEREQEPVEAIPEDNQLEQEPLLEAGQPAIPIEPLDEFAETPQQPETQWFAFWSPFRSEIAANGFIGRLQSVTGLDYRVVKVGPGDYEVAFAYATDDEIEANLATIAAATGLELAGLR